MRIFSETRLSPEALVLAANAAGRRWTGGWLSICYDLSGALRQFLLEQGHTADTFFAVTTTGQRRLTKVTGRYHYPGEGLRTTPHCVTLWNRAGEFYILDATIDQRGGYRPCAVRVSSDWMFGEETVLVEQPRGVVRYTASEWRAPRRFSPELVRLIAEEVAA